MSVAAAFAMFAMTIVPASPAAAAPVAAVDAQGAIVAPARTSMSLHDASGVKDTANAHEPRAGLSLVKLYIADWVYEHGTSADATKATQMIRTSDDAIASQLYAKYPTSISGTAAEYGLGDTVASPRWGYSKTSAADVASFVDAKRRANPSDPVLLAMASAAPVAADGYAQNYGTAQLPGVIGTKWGWSDDRTSMHASVSFGADFTVAAITYGTRDQHTADVRAAMSGTAAADPEPGDAPKPGDGVIPGLPGSGSAEDLPLPPGLRPSDVTGAIPGVGDLIRF